MRIKLLEFCSICHKVKILRVEQIDFDDHYLPEDLVCDGCREAVGGEGV